VHKNVKSDIEIIDEKKEKRRRQNPEESLPRIQGLPYDQLCKGLPGVLGNSLETKTNKEMFHVMLLKIFYLCTHVKQLKLCLECCLESNGRNK